MGGARLVGRRERDKKSVAAVNEWSGSVGRCTRDKNTKSAVNMRHWKDIKERQRKCSGHD